MLEVSVWHQGLIVWQLALLEAALPIVRFMVFMAKSLPETREAEPIGSAFFMTDDGA